MPVAAPMAKLAQVTRNFGHHVVSGLCPLLPALYWECHRIPLWRVVIDLLSDDPLPSEIRGSSELSVAVHALREKFLSTLAKHSPVLEKSVRSFVIEVEFTSKTPEELRRLVDSGGYDFHDPDYACRVVATDSAGRQYDAFFSNIA
jgi:hypothetical protein